ncbi:hypothetical protein D9619_012646 [Psilocybe cf. subviscida]|uniref:Protein kinase domain-containing protein n=1 Tax=Psilocybe cf. subviscida TaxID=2480587 RepID=A0A8H5EZ65_9AGAR|nr:hypothetical protein D9619_012646 [Psilocybe cf. subviscida]
MMGANGFTSVTLHNCVNGATLKPLLLDITPSYPAPAYYPAEQARHVPGSWARQNRPTVEGNLGITLLHRISEGRIGVVYLARVEKALRDGIDITSSLPETLCVKFAKQHHCRSLAREAWFYEQLHQWHGISVPSYYGFYTSTASEQGLSTDTFQPWINLRKPSKIDPAFIEDQEVAETYRSMDWLWDDAPYMFRIFSPSKYRNKARWFRWNFNEENPNIGLIIMENLGKPCTQIWRLNEPGDAFKADILAVLEDVAGDGLCHTDIAARNFLQYDGPETDERRCPRHDIVHKWRLIDFDRSCMLDMTNIDSDGEYALDVDRNRVGHPLAFWGEQISEQ